MSLLNEETKFKQRGIHNIDARITSGSVQLQISVDGQTPKDLPGGLFISTNEASVSIELPECELTTVNTGVAEVYVNFVRS